jgi:hypothetical protein
MLQMLASERIRAENHKEEKDRLKEENDRLQKDNKNKSRLLLFYKQKDQEEQCNNKVGADDKLKRIELDNFVFIVEKALSQAFPGKHASTKAKALQLAIESGKLLKGHAANCWQEAFTLHVRHLFHPWKLVKASDVSPAGAFKTSSINALHDVIDEEGLGLFPSTSSINRARALLDKHAFGLIGYERKQTKYGEVFFLDFKKSLRLLLEACGLHSLAQSESVKVSMSLDGADYFRDRTHVSTGMKVNDTRGCHPTTKQPLLIRNIDQTETICNIQSQEVCCIMIVADACDKKELYQDVFADFYRWGESLRTEGLPASIHGPALKPFDLTHCSDIKATWHLSNRGRDCKNTNLFCHLCSCTSHSLLSYHTGESRCERCIRRDNGKCYHHEACDTIKVAELLQKLEEELNSYHALHRTKYDEVKSKSKLQTDLTASGKENDITHIEYVIPLNDDGKLREYTQFIVQECRLHKIPLIGRMDDWLSALTASAAMERYLMHLEKVREWYESGRMEVPLVEVVELLIPCILHLENRVGEKNINMILRSQFDLYKGPKVEFIQQLTKTFQEKVLGTEESPAQWKLKYTQEKDSQIKIDKIQVRNQVARCMIKSVDAIIESAIPETEHQLGAKLISAVHKYHQGMKLLQQHRILTANEMELFQDYIDDFFEHWVEIYGEEGVTNYIHMLGAGHILYFVKKHGCLYLYSQQGWESLNNKIQAFIHQNTARGGYGTGEGSGKSYMFPLVCLIMRDLLWKVGKADRFFMELEENGN